MIFLFRNFMKNFKDLKSYKKIIRTNGLMGGDNFRTYRRFFDDLSPEILSNRNEMVLGLSDFRDLYVVKFFDKQVREGKSVLTEKIQIKSTKQQFLDFIRVNYGKNVVFSKGDSKIVIDCVGSIIEGDMDSNSVTLRFHGSFEDNEKNKSYILNFFEEIAVYINWIINNDMDSAYVPVENNKLPMTEMYPFLKEDLLSYYERFFNSNSTILLLIGPPGTGKTSFIRGYLSMMKQSGIVTYDKGVIQGDAIFSEFISGESNALVFEDADLFLSARTEGNDLMHRFLNVGDGLVSISGKKLIFSTNLSNIKDIDPAFLRPGRCFDVLNFNLLDYNQATLLANRVGIKREFDKGGSYTVAEIFNSMNSNVDQKSSFGFGV